MPGSAHPGDPWASLPHSLAQNPAFPSSSRGNPESRFHKPTQETQACPFPEPRVPSRTLVSQAGCLLVPPPGPRSLDLSAQPRGPFSLDPFSGPNLEGSRHWPTLWGSPSCVQIVLQFAPPTFWLVQPEMFPRSRPARPGHRPVPELSMVSSLGSLASPISCNSRQGGGAGGVGNPSLRRAFDLGIPSAPLPAGPQGSQAHV